MLTRIKEFSYIASHSYRCALLACHVDLVHSKVIFVCYSCTFHCWYYFTYSKYRKLSEHANRPTFEQWRKWYEQTKMQHTIIHYDYAYCASALQKSRTDRKWVCSMLLHLIESMHVSFQNRPKWFAVCERERERKSLWMCASGSLCWAFPYPYLSGGEQIFDWIY